MSGELLNLTKDLVFQELFGKQKNKDITAHLLSLILNRKIKNIDLDVNKRMLGNRKNSKTGRLDIRAKFNDGEDCNIELQVEPYPYMEKRMLEYWGSMYDAKINSGDSYKVLKPTISILIADYQITNLKHISKYHTIWNLREKDFSDTILTNDIEMHILEIPKINDNEMLKDELVQWLRFIKEPENKGVEKFMEENKYLKQARKELEHLSGDPDFKRLLESRAGFLRDVDAKMEVAEEKGREEGKKQTQIEVAKKMKEENMDIEQISKITNLTIKEITEL
ncbi:MAG: Rpn family recombination-promoting nuclease/putative transposase [Clostridia bacterium]|nr:Rpn family recombination-promoting nuclease/putative transposase [Clostridia bacterium]